MRNHLFRILYWITSVFFAFLALPLAILPGRRLLMRWLQLYSKAMVWLMNHIVGIKIEFRGLDKIPSSGCIVAPKHQSWGDGYAVFSQIEDLAIVTGNHLENLPLVGFILRKMEAIVVDNCGGVHARDRLVGEEMARVREQNRKLLIYPEGHLAPVGFHYRYRKGIFFMYEQYQCPVVPAATNLGLFWPGEEWTLRPGTAVLEFLDPIEPGLDKEAFMARLEEQIETSSIDLLPDDFELPKYRALEYDKETDSGIPIIPEDAEVDAAE